jgi:hypothetical protein
VPPLLNEEWLLSPEGELSFCGLEISLDRENAERRAVIAAFDTTKRIIAKSSLDGILSASEAS